MKLPIDLDYFNKDIWYKESKEIHLDMYSRAKADLMPAIWLSNIDHNIELVVDESKHAKRIAKYYTTNPKYK